MLVTKMELDPRIALSMDDITAAQIALRPAEQGVCVCESNVCVRTTKDKAIQPPISTPQKPAWFGNISQELHERARQNAHVDLCTAVKN